MACLNDEINRAGPDSIPTALSIARSMPGVRRGKIRANSLLSWRSKMLIHSGSL